MTEWLVLQLFGPIASWGETAGLEFRPTWDRPSRSSVIGLISASLGICHGEEDKLNSINEGYNLAFRSDYRGIPISDFHIAKVPSAEYQTRRKELLAPYNSINTVLSVRDYYCDSCFTVFVIETDNSPYPLKFIAKKLIEPEFVLYLGRKSCPLALPLNPRLIYAESLNDACKLVKSPDLPSLKKDNRIFWEDDIPSGLSVLQTVIRRDMPVSYTRRQFANRNEYMAIIC